MTDIRTFTDEQEAVLSALEIESDGYVRLTAVCQNLLNEQGQYVAYHFESWHPSYPCLTDGLKVGGDDEYSYRIHKDDVREFIVRLRKHRRDNHLPCA